MITIFLLCICNYYYFQTNISLRLDLHMHQSHAGSSESLALQYFAKLNETRVKKLYQMYKLDFLMFGYDPNPYLEVAITVK